MTGFDAVAYFGIAALCFCVLWLDRALRDTRRGLAKTAQLLADHAQNAAEVYAAMATVTETVADLWVAHEENQRSEVVE